MSFVRPENIIDRVRNGEWDGVIAAEMIDYPKGARAGIHDHGSFISNWIMHRNKDIFKYIFFCDDTKNMYFKPADIDYINWFHKGRNEVTVEEIQFFHSLGAQLLDSKTVRSAIYKIFETIGT